MKKHLLYLRYVVRHKWFVLAACIRLRVPIIQALIHDWTKFLPCEWFPYVRFFYGMPKVGDVLAVNCIDGFGGMATVIERRQHPNCQYKVRMNNGYMGEDQEFWAHDFEVDGIDEAKRKFDDAWNHHQKCNKHHWQYWLLTLDDGGTEALEMPDRYMREMVADWIGAGRALGFPDTAGWYEKNKDKMILNIHTRSRVEATLDMLKVPAKHKAIA